MLQPRGQYYEATVPDTLDLAERAKLSVHGLTLFLDATTDYAPWGHFAVDSSRPALLDRAGGWPNWGKIAEATAKMRYMCGSTEGIDNQLASLRGMIAKLPPSTVPNNGFVPHARVLIALTYLYQLTPTPALHDLIVAYGNGFKKSVRNMDDCSYCGAEVPPDLGEKGGNVIGWMNPFVDGTSARAIAMWGTLDKDPSYIALAQRLAKGLLPAKYWSPEAEPKAVVGGERGHFMGHMHSYVQGMLGMLYAADTTHDARLMEFVRSGYEYQRNFGIARVGLFGEGCTTGDMTQLAIKLSESGVGEYWEDVDCYVRNHLIEIQLMDRDSLAASHRRRWTGPLPTTTPPPIATTPMRSIGSSAPAPTTPRTSRKPRNSRQFRRSAARATSPRASTWPGRPSCVARMGRPRSICSSTVPRPGWTSTVTCLTRAKW